MPERARTDLWEPQGSNPLGPPGPELLVRSSLDCKAQSNKQGFAGSDPRGRVIPRHLPVLLLPSVGPLKERNHELFRTLNDHLQLGLVCFHRTAGPC